MPSSEHDVAAAYDQLAEFYAQRFGATEPESPIDLGVLDQLVALLPASARVLDAGCGTGRISRYLADRGCAIDCVDVSAAMLAVARRERPEIPTVLGSITDLPYADGSFDAAVYWYSIVHLPDAALPRVFAEAARVLRDGGLVAVAFQVGDDVRDLGRSLARLGHDVSLQRYHRQGEVVLAVAAAHGLFPLAQVTREPLGDERDPQAFAILRRG